MYKCIWLANDCEGVSGEMPPEGTGEGRRSVFNLALSMKYFHQRYCSASPGCRKSESFLCKVSLSSSVALLVFSVGCGPDPAAAKVSHLGGMCPSRRLRHISSDVCLSVRTCLLSNVGQSFFRVSLLS